MQRPLFKLTNIAENLTQIQKNMQQYCNQYHRDNDSVQLLAVSKTKPASDIKQAYAAGQICFGENYLQEALEKIAELNDLPLEWHFIGAIQSNKTKDLAEHFDWVHSVDRLKIARRLSQQRNNTMKPLNICIQVNISNEESKSGVKLNELSALANEITTLKNITLRGLMAIPVKAQSINEQRAEFSKMRHALNDLQITYPKMDTLSMGMSNDMEAAIAEGSTILRIGSAIFGARDTRGL